MSQTQATNEGETMTKTQAISTMILAAIKDGKDVREAVDAVLGVGTFEKLAGDLYDALRAK